MTIEELKTGCFGKLPNFGDFVRYNFNGQEEQLFDQWLQEGLHFAKIHLDHHWQQAYQTTSTYHFFFSPDDTEGMLVGLLQPSFDKSERKYPFIMSLQIDSTQLENNLTPFVPLIFEQFFHRAQEFMEQAYTGLQLSEIPTQVDNIHFSLEDVHSITLESFNGYLESTTVEAFWNRISGDFNDPRKYLLLKNLTDILLPLRNQDPARMALGLRFPLGMNQPPVVGDVCFWIQLSLRLLNEPLIRPNYFWTYPKPGVPCYLFLFFRLPSPKNFEYFMIPDSENDTICKLERDGNAENAFQALPLEYQSLLQNKDYTLKNLLEFING